MTSTRRLAQLFKRLTKRCGGLEESETALDCRVKKSQLQRYGDPESGQSPPLWVVAELEEYAKEPIVTRALAEAVAGAASDKDVVTEGAEALSAVAEFVRSAVAAKTPRERDDALAKADPALSEVRDLISALQREDA